MKHGLRILVIAAVLALSGCGYQALYSELDEQQANEMLALLLAHEVEAKKKTVNQHWVLQTTSGDFSRAMQLLKANGYPRERFQSLGDIFKKEGFVSSPLEEKARLLYGLSQELSNTISAIDGVIVARVHIAIPEKNVLNESTAPSSASVFIKHRSESQVVSQLPGIKALVVNSVEGLPYDKVTVTLFPAEPVAFVIKEKPQVVEMNLGVFSNALQKPYGLLLAALMGIAVIALIAVWICWRTQQIIGSRR